jgi:hypothetical protein
MWRTGSTQDYRRGYVEGYDGKRNAYLLLTGAKDVAEYERGFADGKAARRAAKRAAANQSAAPSEDQLDD